MIKIHIAFNETVRSMELESINELKKVNLCGNWISTLDNITELSITEDFVIITTEDPVFRDGNKQSHDFNECSVDIIKAYDWNGRFRWNISDIIKDIAPPVYGGFVIEKSTITPYLEGASLEDHSHPLYACFVGAWKYVVDVKNGCVLLKLPVK